MYNICFYFLHFDSTIWLNMARLSTTMTHHFHLTISFKMARFSTPVTSGFFDDSSLLNWFSLLDEGFEWKFFLLWSLTSTHLLTMTPHFHLTISFKMARFSTPVTSGFFDDSSLLNWFSLLDEGFEWKFFLLWSLTSTHLLTLGKTRWC